MTGILHIAIDKSYRARTEMIAGCITRAILVLHAVMKAGLEVGMRDVMNDATSGTVEGHQASKHLGPMHLLLVRVATDMALRPTSITDHNLMMAHETRGKVRMLGLLRVRRMVMTDRLRFHLDREGA